MSVATEGAVEGVRLPGRLPSQLAVRVEGLTKRYVARGGQPGRGDQGDRREVWALRDVSFDVPTGKSMGLIGANGAGKTTLLKVLARLTPPTSGRVLVRGQVSPLLEYVVSFLEAEETAQDNVFLLARLFGVPKTIARRRMPEILEFAEVESLSQLATKRYSTGLLRRLAFSVVLNLEPGILLADETVAVGDAAFQERCRERLEVLSRQGLVVVLASHDLAMIRRMCHQVIWLREGRVVAHGPPDLIIPLYEATTSQARARELQARRALKEQAAPRAGRSSMEPTPAPDEVAREKVERAQPSQDVAEVAIRSAAVYSADGSPVAVLSAGNDAVARVMIEASAPGTEIRCFIAFSADGKVGVRLMQAHPLRIEQAGVYSLSVPLRPGVLTEPLYSARVRLFVRREGERTEIRSEDAFAIRVEGSGETAESHGPGDRIDVKDLVWTLTPLAVAAGA